MPTLTIPQPEARPAVVFSQYWMDTLVIRSPAPGGEASAHVTLVPYSPVTGEIAMNSVNFTMDNLFKLAETDPVLATALGTVMTVVQTYAIAQGLVSAPA